MMFILVILLEVVEYDYNLSFCVACLREKMKFFDSL